MFGSQFVIVKLSYLRPFIASLFKKSCGHNITVLTRNYICSDGWSGSHYSLDNIVHHGATLWEPRRGMMAISRVKMRPELDSQLQLSLASRELSRACSVGRWASRMSGKYPTLQTGGGGVRDISLSDQSSGHN